MRTKREQAKASAAMVKAKAKAEAQARAEAEAAAAKERDVVPWLRELGFNAEKARRGAELCAHMPAAPLEERLKHALRGLAPRCQRWTLNGASGSA